MDKYSCDDSCPMSSGGYAITDDKGFLHTGNPPELRHLLADIFTDEFMKKYTRFENYAAFRYSGSVIVNLDADPLIYIPQLFDNFVKESTNFLSWEEMVKTATDIRFSVEK